MSPDEFASAAPAGSVARRWWNPTVVHAVSVLLGLAYILVLSGGQWFFGDDWAIIAPHLDASLMQPHVGHWNLIPALFFMALRQVVGVGSYLPFLALALVAHVAVVHLTWRILKRVGGEPWLATGLAAMLMVLGGGAENILWAFQFGFMGAIALGLAVVVLIDTSAPRLPVWRFVLIIVLAVVAPMFSGTAIPVLVAAGVLGWIRRGPLRTAALLLPAAIVYLTWYLVVARSADLPEPGFRGLADTGRALVYAAAMYGGGLGRALPWIGLGVIPAAAVLGWLVVTLRHRKGHGPIAPALALAAGSLVFVALTTYSRLDNGLSSAASQRYAYLTITLLLPALALVATAIAARSRRAFVAILCVIVVLIGWNAVVLGLEAHTQAAREAQSRQRIDAALEKVLADPTSEALLQAPADPMWAPDLLGSDLLVLSDHGLQG